MLELDQIDIKNIRELHYEDVINKLNKENVDRIYKYLIENGVYYAKDIFVSDLELFLLDSNEFIKKFEKVKNKLGNDFIEKLGEDTYLIEMMYED